MRIIKRISVIALIAAILPLAIACNSRSTDGWSMKQARIMTPWAEKVDPENVLPEYPRPQMVRQNWMNLNGVWDFGRVSGFGYDPEQTFDKKILVPFPMESAISGVMDTDFMENKGKVFAYDRDIVIPKSMEGQEILLHFGAVDWKCEVYVNGTKVGTHTGGFDPFYFDITSALKPGRAKQNIRVLVQDTQEFGGYPHGKQKINEKVIWYTPTTGIWQTVWIEPVPEVHIEKVEIVPDVDNSKFSLNTVVPNAPAGLKVNATVYDNGEKILEVKDMEPNAEAFATIENPKLWSPDSPFLYDIEIELVQDGKVVDKVSSYFGMRKISLGELNGHPVFMLNNEYCFSFGPLDQGFWPDGIYTAPTDEALRFDLEKTKEYGMNTSRKHIKVEPARWYYHCDKMGILVWQDMPCNGFGEKGKLLDSDISIRDNYHDELGRMIESLKHFPSVIMWVVYNEGWGQPNAEISRKGVDIARSHDDTRLVSVASGWHDTEYGDIKDTHSYPAPNMNPNPVNERASVCGEYGGITLRIPDHRWIGGSNMQYTEVHSPDELTDRYLSFLRSIDIMRKDGLTGAIYTQITDVEDEENGLLTYDRKVNKAGAENVKRIAAETRKLYSSKLPRAVVETAKKSEQPIIWSYLMTDRPIAATDWMNPSFNASAWKKGPAGFGREVGTIKTEWNTPYIYLRRTVDFNGLSKEDLANLKLYIFHDEDAEVYINGVKAASFEGYVTNYILSDISDEALATIEPGKPNVIAVSCKQTTGGQYIDLGFYVMD